MQNQGEIYVSDSEFYEYIRYNQLENFKSRINAAYLSSLRFTNVDRFKYSMVGHACSWLSTTIELIYLTVY
jgi:hypothetical protein